MARYHSLLHWRKQMPSSGSITKTMKFGNFQKRYHYLILDFESTCEYMVSLKNQEVIEFPCIWVDSNLNVVSTFHKYVKPVYNPVLTPFCTQLTGIVQEMVEKEETFDQVLSRFLTWIKNTEATIGNQQTKTFITCGDWDLKVMLPNQCKLSKLPVPPIMTHWLNLKKVFYEYTNYYPKSLKDMCHHLDYKFTGREHSGIDDCRNILEILRILKARHSILLRS
ncbi:ERI1 exoribonuclease 3-like [Macrosteles quadrilineatus]|uniref:ERI1 exoribonuclease 3-like n=1 Tax=Macrosteles quadrilineatus TaxID=74068 RepID=UPI0023E19D40|nr:ERI1 exoribonuclease 3-like [Macrosteles quadrilineatus]